MYGLMLLLGIAACIGLTGLRWTRRGGDWDLVLRVAVWGVAFGIVGARAYHVITSWNEVPDEWWGVFAVWKGGLGVWGGILLGCIAGAVVVRRSGESVFAFMDARRAGAAGRAGDRPRRQLVEPGALRHPDRPALGSRDRPRAPAAASTRDSETFHPTFLYEGLWNLFAAGVLLLVDRFFRIRPPALFALYVSLYTAFRMYEETLRIDRSHEFCGSAAELLGRARAVRPVDGVLRLVADRPAVAASGDAAARAEAAGPSGDGDPEGPRPVAALASRAVLVRELDLDLEAFEGPFDLLLTLVLKDELPAGDVDVAAIVVEFCERLAERDELDLEACGEFLVLVAGAARAQGAGALRARRGRGRLDARPGRGGRGAGRAARRVPAHPRGGRAGWPSGSDEGSVLPGRAGAVRTRAGAAARARRIRLGWATRCARWPPSRRRCRSSHMALRFPPVSLFLERFRAVLRRRSRLRLRRRGGGVSRASSRPWPSWRCSSCARAARSTLEQAAPFAPIRVGRPLWERR